MLTRAELEAANSLAFSLPRIADALEKIAKGLEDMMATKYTLKSAEEMTDEQREKIKHLTDSLPGGIVSPGPDDL